MATYVVSDLHGQYDIFQALLRKIEFSESDFLYVIGDAIDRGSDGIKLLQTIRKAPNMDLLIGNHEYMMLNAVAPDGSVEDLPGRDAKLWMERNGGDVTFAAYKRLPFEERVDLLNWMNTRKFSTLVSVSGKIICLTHSYFQKRFIDEEYQKCDYKNAHDIVWLTPFRWDLYVDSSEYQKTGWDFIIGHVPVQNLTGIKDDWGAYHEENITLIDGGCAARGRGPYDESTYGVICLRLEDREEIVMSFKDLAEMEENGRLSEKEVSCDINTIPVTEKTENSELTKRILSFLRNSMRGLIGGEKSILIIPAEEPSIFYIENYAAKARPLGSIGGKNIPATHDLCKEMIRDMAQGIYGYWIHECVAQAIFSGVLTEIVVPMILKNPSLSAEEYVRDVGEFLRKRDRLINILRAIVDEYGGHSDEERLHTKLGANLSQLANICHLMGEIDKIQKELCQYYE